MYKHSVYSIKESDDKQFISLEEKTKFNNYENEFRRKDDSYTRLETDNKIKEISDVTYDNVEGNYITVTDTLEGNISNIEILGNTYQDVNDLSHILSSGILREDGTYEISILSYNKNLFDMDKLEKGFINISTGIEEINDLRTRSKGYINVRGFRVVTFSIDTIPIEAIRIYEYDKNFNFIKETGFREIKRTIRLMSNTEYLRFSYASDINYVKTCKIQLEEGTEATPYVPHETNKSTIILPCVLEKVGDVSDRLYYDDVEKAWCIEKWIETLNINDCTISTMGQLGGGNRFNINKTNMYFNYYASVNTISSIISYDAPIPSEVIVPFVTSNSTSYIIVTPLDIVTLNDFVRWYTDNGHIVKYRLITPEKIVLPLSTQIQLNSFFGTTNIWNESGEVDVTIKASIPKSLGASVNSLQSKINMIDNRINIIENMKDSQNIAYQTEKGYMNCLNTDNGMVNKLRLQGKTLVNILGDKGSCNRLSDFSVATGINASIDNGSLRIISNNSTGTASLIINDLKPNSIFTLIYKVKVNSYISGDMACSIRRKDWSYIDTIVVDKSGERLYIVKTETDNTDGLILRFGQWTEGTGDISIDDIMLIEGDHTQNPPSYFEGIMSVKSDKIELLSRKEDGNLMDFDKYLKDCDVDYIINDNIYTFDINQNLFTNGFEIRTNDRIVFSCKVKCGESVTNFRMVILYTDGTYRNSEYINSTDFTECVVVSDIGKEVSKVRLDWSSRGVLGIKDIQIRKGSTLKSYVPYISHKKPILYKNDTGEWISLTELREWDSIEKHSDGKYYLHVRSGEIVLNGSENSWTISGVSHDSKDILRFYVDINSKNSPNDVQGFVMSDKFSANSYDGMFHLNVEGVSVTHNNKIGIGILKSKLETPDVNGFKKWLQSNNVTVVYQLEEEKIYEVNNLDLKSYEGETAIICNSGTINPIMEFEITRHINEAFKVLEDRVHSLESEVLSMYNMFKQVLSGDMQSLAYKLYPEDFINEHIYDVYKPELLI